MAYSPPDHALANIQFVSGYAVPDHADADIQFRGEGDQFVGVLSATLDGCAAAIDGVVWVTGGINATLGGVTADIEGARGEAGTFSAALDGAAATAAGSVAYAGDFAGVLDDLTAEITGFFEIAGTLDTTLEGFTLRASGYGDKVRCTFTSTLDDLTATIWAKTATDGRQEITCTINDAVYQVRNFSIHKNRDADTTIEATLVTPVDLYSTIGQRMLLFKGNTILAQGLVTKADSKWTPRGATAEVSASEAVTWPGGYSVTLTGISYRTVSGGDLRLRCAVDPDINPADSVVIDGESWLVKYATSWQQYTEVGLYHG